MESLLVDLMKLVSSNRCNDSMQQEIIVGKIMEEAFQHSDKQPSLQRLIKRLDVQSISQLKKNLNQAAYIVAYPAQKLYLQNI